MPFLKYDNILGGMNVDVPYHVLKENEWSDLKNARTWVRSIDKVGGYVNEFSYTLGLTQPQMLKFWTPINSAGVSQGYFVYAKGGNIRRISPVGDANIAQGGTAYTNIINTGTPTIDPATEWNFTAMSGGYNMVVSNPVIKPQYMNGDGTALADLPNWGNEAIVVGAVASTCTVIRAYKNQLIAGNITYRLSNGTIVQRPSTILISDKAAPGGVPQTWLSTATNAADNFELTTSNPILEILILRDNVVVFTYNDIFLIGESTSQSATPVRQISSSRGILGKGCAVVVDGICYAVTNNDIIKFDGSSTNFQSIANDIVKTNFYEIELNINAGNSVFVIYHQYFNEILIAYPSKASGGTVCDRALIYSLDDGAWSWTELPGIYDGVSAPVVGAGSGDALRPWTLNTYNNNVQRIHFASSNQLQALDIGWSRNGPYEVILEKFFDLHGVTGAATNVVKMLEAIYPVLIGSGSATIYANFYQSPQTTISWASPDITMQYDIDQNLNYKISPHRRGRFMAIRIVSNTNMPLMLCHFGFDLKPSGTSG